MVNIKRISSNRISTLEKNEIFVFGSNLAGQHGGGAARFAYEKFGAVWGQGTGLHGQSYAIPTMQGGVETIAPYVNEFLNFAKVHTELKFLVTEIGCGIAGFKPSQMAPLFHRAVDGNIENVHLPVSFWELIECCGVLAYWDESEGQETGVAFLDDSDYPEVWSIIKFYNNL